MRVTVRLGEPLWRAVGQRRVEIEAPGERCTLPELVQRLEAAYPQLRAELSAGAAGDGVDYHFTFFLRDRMVKPADMAAEHVADGEEVMIVLPMAGG
ncbi:MAG TPA: MoaD/ThiS family protein [Chloroflexota bacterium]|jgi:molybdopterin converting factor small subunit|nr:MoaD/ThiS family protein [Chloroflexota bacterium]